MSDQTPVEDGFDEDVEVEDTGDNEYVDAPSDDFDDVEGSGI